MNSAATKSTLLAPYLATEEVRERFETSLTLVDLYGAVGEYRTHQEAYCIRVHRESVRKFLVVWAARTIRPNPCLVHPVAYWGKPWQATFKTEAEAVAFAREKLEVLRGWAAKRAAVAA